MEHTDKRELAGMLTDLNRHISQLNGRMYDTLIYDKITHLCIYDIELIESDLNVLKKKIEEVWKQ